MTHADLNIFEVIKGTDAAWRDVYTCFWRQLVYYAIQKGLGQEDAEDAASLAITKVYQFRARLLSTKHLNNVLYKAVAQCAVSSYRERKHATRRERIYFSEQVVFSDPLEEEIDLHRVLTEVIAYIATLPKKYQEVAERVIEEYGTRQPQHHNTFYVHLYRLRAKLNRKFNIS